MSQQDILKLFSKKNNLLSADVARILGISTTAAIRSMSNLIRQNEITFNLIRIKNSKHPIRIYNLNPKEIKKKYKY